MSSLFSSPRRWTRAAAVAAAPLTALGLAAVCSPVSAAPAAPAAPAQQHAQTQHLPSGLSSAAQHAGVVPLGWGKGHQTAQLSAGDGAQGDNFSSSVAISPDGKTAVIGAINRQLHTGAAYIFVRKGSTWTEAQELTASDGAQYDYYGYAVAVSRGGSTVLVSAYGHSSQAGAVYAYARDGKQWAQTDEFVGNDTVQGDAFGWSLELSRDGSTAMIGAPDQNDWAGAVYTFGNDGGTWAQTGELTASDAGPTQQFGYTISVASNRKTAIIGSPDNNDLVGAAYVFSLSDGAWTQTAELTASDGASFDEFGYSVAMSHNGRQAIIGAYGQSNYTGGAYVFSRRGGTWSQTAELTASDGAEYSDFGYTVAMADKGATVVVGSQGFNNLVGATYVFHRKAGTWRQETELALSGGVSMDEFGYSTSITPDGSTLLVGAYGRASGTGAAYLFTK